MRSTSTAAVHHDGTSRLGSHAGIGIHAESAEARVKTAVFTRRSALSE
jgi:hypothetical protein